MCLSLCLVAEATFQRQVCADMHSTHTLLKPGQEQILFHVI